MINKGTVAVGLILGSAIGVALGVMIAPDKGSKTRAVLKKEANSIKEQISKDAIEVKDDLVKSARSGKEALKKHIEEFTSSASFKTEAAITFLERQLANLKESNKKYQKTV